MNIFRRTLPILSSLLLIGALELLVSNPALVWAIMVVIIAVNGITSTLLSRGEIRGGRWHFTVLGLLFGASALSFLTLLQTDIYQHIHIISVGIIWWLWSEQLYRFAFDPQNYIPFSVANITSLITIITSFYLMTSLFAMKLLLGYSIIWLTAITALAVFLFVIEIIWSEKLSPWRYWSIPLIIGLITAELFWVMNYLPSGYMVNGLLITLVLYITVNLSRFYIKKQMSRTVVWRYLLIGFVMVILTILSARWV